MTSRSSDARATRLSRRTDGVAAAQCRYTRSPDWTTAAASSGETRRMSQAYAVGPGRDGRHPDPKRVTFGPVRGRSRGVDCRHGRSPPRATFRVRAIGPDDREALVRFYAGLSPDSRAARFHGATGGSARRRPSISAGRITTIARASSQSPSISQAGRRSSATSASSRRTRSPRRWRSRSPTRGSDAASAGHSFRQPSTGPERTVSRRCPRRCSVATPRSWHSSARWAAR